MKRAGRIAIRLGLDGNPLRRRIDRVSVLGTAGLLAVFLAAAPVASIAVAGVVARADVVEQHAEHNWRTVQAVLLQDAPVLPGSASGSSEAWARWVTPSGHTMEGLITVQADTKAGTRVPIWIQPSGQWGGVSRLSTGSAQARVILAVVGVSIGLALALCWVWFIFHQWLDRRRLAGWAARWDVVGPHWTKQFRSHGI